MQLGWRYKNILFQEYLETGNMKTNFPWHRSQETYNKLVMPYAYLCPTCTNSNLMSIHQRRLHCVPASWIWRIFAQRSQQCETISSSLISYSIFFSDSFNHSISGSLCFILWWKVLSKTKTQQTLETLENQKNRKLHCRHCKERKCVNIHPICEEWRLWSHVLPLEKTID